jgi:hypothetical protein
MLSVCWSEDRDGCLVANWYDDERAERGGFAETVVAMDDYRDEPLVDETEPDEDDDEQALWQPRVASVGRR